MPDDQTNYKKIIDDATNELKAEDDNAKKLLDEIDKKIADIDFRYAKMKNQTDINNVASAKSIVEKKWGLNNEDDK